MLVEFDPGEPGRLDAVELQQKIGVEEGAAIFAVGDRFEAEPFLIAYDVADRVVLDRAKLLRADRVGRLAAARLEQRLGPQEAADLVGAERRPRLASCAFVSIGSSVSVGICLLPDAMSRLATFHPIARARKPKRPI